MKNEMFNFTLVFMRKRKEGLLNQLYSRFVSGPSSLQCIFDSQSGQKRLTALTYDILLRTEQTQIAMIIFVMSSTHS